MKKQILAPSILALFVASAAHAGATFDTAAGSLYLGGDVEFDYTSQDGQTLDWDLGTENAVDGTFDATGRLLIDINGQRVLDNGAFAAFKVNPYWGQNGSTGSDDVWVQFGMKNNWDIKAGHFEAADLSPAGQDTYIATTGTSTMYRASDARGRTGEDTSNEAQVTFTKTLTDSMSFELTGQSQQSGDLIIARPVLTYSMDRVSVAAGAEVPVHDHNDNQDWVGFGLTTTFQATDDLAITLRGAMKSGDNAVRNTVDDDGDYTGGYDGDAWTAGIGAQYQNLFAGVLYGEDSLDDSNAETDETQYYVSYKIPAVMDIDNFDIYLAASMATGDASGQVNGNNLDNVDIDDTIGGRIRLKYTF